MNKPKLTLINGTRDQIEQDLVEALFGSDETQITRVVDLLNKIGDKKSQVMLVTPPQTSLSTKD